MKEIKTGEELLKPRYKVIADYPCNEFMIGDIFTFSVVDSYDVPFDTKHSVFLPTVAKYPHLFKKLDWWEDREESEMPQYVEWVNKKMIIKVNRWLKRDNGWSIFDFGASAFRPATQQEYENYINGAN